MVILPHRRAHFRAAPAETDPYFANVSLLLHLDSDFTDSSPSPKTVTANGNAQISNAQSKWGGASALFDGTGDYLTTESSTDFAPGTGDFTIETWCRSSITAATAIIDTRVGGDGWVAYYDGSGHIGFYMTGQSFRLGTIVVSTGNWVHLAWARQSGVLRMFVGGVKDYEGTDDYTLGTSAIALTIGANTGGGSGGLSGNLDDLRITKGVARYTENFTPPTAAFPNS